MAVLHYRELIAWQKAMEVVTAIYQVSRLFPAEERFGLTNQIRRAAVSIPSNIAEGQGRGIGGEFAHHLRIANGSRQEVETQLLIALQLGFVEPNVANPLLEQCYELGRVLRGLYESVTGK